MPIYIKQDTVKFRQLQGNDYTGNYYGVDTISDTTTQEKIATINSAASAAISNVESAKTAANTAAATLNDKVSTIETAIANVENYAVDPTLTLANTAAEAKATGDAINNLKNAFTDIATVADVSLYVNGTPANNARTVVLSDVGIVTGKQYRYTIGSYAGAGTITRIRIVCRDTNNDTLLDTDNLLIGDTGYLTPPAGTTNFRITAYISNETDTSDRKKLSIFLNRLENDGEIEEIDRLVETLTNDVDVLKDKIDLQKTNYNNLKDLYTPKYTIDDLSTTEFEKTASGQSWNFFTFFSNSGNLEINIKSTQSVSGDFRVQYYDGTWHTHLRTLFNSGTTNTVLHVDCVSLEQYQNATNFRLQLVLDNLGTLTITEFMAYEKDNFSTFELYDPQFKSMMANVFQAIANASGDGDVVLTAPNGKKYELNVANDGTLSTVPTIPDKMLIMGNSIVFGFQNQAETERFGMAATRAEYDFANKIIAYTQAVNPDVVATKLYSSPFEHCTTLAAAQSFISDNQSVWTDDLNLVIIEMGDNVNTAEKRTVFADSFPLLLETIRTRCPHARIMLVGIWFNNGNVFRIMSENAQKFGCVFVDIRGIRSVETQGELNATVYFEDGTTTTVTEARVTHPGNLGMERIAEAIEAKLGY